MSSSTLDSVIRDRARALFAAIEEEQPGLFNKQRWTGAMMDWCMRDEAFKVNLFRFVDVYPALRKTESLTRHLEAYFGGETASPAVLKWGLKGAGLTGAIGARLMSAGIRANIEEMAKQFIVGEDGKAAARRMGGLRKDGFSVVADLLGEATVTPREEAEFEEACIDLVDGMARARASWTPLGGGAGSLDWGHAPMVHLSVKPSALCCTARPVDFEESVRAIEERMARIYRKVLEADGEMCVDMESLKYKDITLEVYRRLRSRPEFRAHDRLGLVLQAYLRASEHDLEKLLDWSRRENLPIALRLVKGAYWDYESVLAEQNGWPRPVWDRKPETDACYERMARRILESHAHARLACASHNIRTIAAVLETARAMNVPESRYEFQVLYGMAEPVRRAVLNQTGRVRLYAPCGAMIPGMAYLVRRLLENTANESFLRQKFAEGIDMERLIEDPADVAAREPSRPPAPAASFRNEPAPDFTRPEEMDAFRAALRTVRGRLGRKCPLLINGADVDTAEWDDSVNPANPGEVVGRIARAGRDEASAAVQAAARAFPAWRDTPPAERARLLRAAAAILRSRLHEEAAWQILEVGKQWDQAHADLGEAIDFLEYYANEMLRLHALPPLLSPPGEANRMTYEPRGVALVIGPWNFPLAISCGMCAAALAMGNTVVYKPSGVSAVIGRRMAEAFREAGLPAGVLNYVPGPGRVIGDYLVDHPDVSLIAFTGSMEIGCRILERAAKVHPGQAYVKRVVCEMGGKNAIIVDDDADLDEAVPGVLYSAFGFQGQKCSACSRVIVPDALHDLFVQRLTEAAASLAVGPSEDPHHYLGPVADAAAQRDILTYIEIARGEGTIAFQGRVPEGAGYYVPPTIVTGIEPHHRIAQEEIFGPVLAVLRARDFNDAIRIANSTKFALTGAVFSRDPDHLDQARREFRVGNLYLNRGSTGAMVARQPFGGARMSGVGTKAGGPDYLLHFSDPRTITENTMRRGFTPESA